MTSEKSESSALLLESPPRPKGFCEGLRHDLNESASDAHTLLHILGLWVACSLQTVAQAQKLGATWETNRWLCRLAIIYWPCWLGLAIIKSCGRWALRVAVCNTVPITEPVRANETAREFEFRAFWSISFCGWYIIVILLSLGQLAFGTLLYEPDELARTLVGAATRGVIACAWIAGTVGLLLAMRKRDTIMLQACVAGFCAFALTMFILLILTIGPSLSNATIDPSLSNARASSSFTIGGVSFELIFALTFSGVAFIMFLWYAIIGVLLWREYVNSVSSGEADALPASESSPQRGWTVFAIALLVCVLICVLNVFADLVDPLGYLDIIG